MRWLYLDADPVLWTGTLRMHPWTGEVPSVTALDGLRLEAAEGPVYPAWQRVLADVARLMSLEQEGLL